ncbi:hypothetical protein CTI12_AA334400 [Artemisia annua]|uniref:Uncharacterized protein n=1 Tax=Artemisia annua TaxID=35608 RepID=A0A2U1MYE4_ARTAN|nr:hypothetical protein CTI12_AA334400 [Artemisia annua]
MEIKISQDNNGLAPFHSIYRLQNENIFTTQTIKASSNQLQQMASSTMALSSPFAGQADEAAPCKLRASRNDGFNEENRSTLRRLHHQEAHGYGPDRVNT